MLHSISNELCYVCSNAVIDIAVSGGTQPYSYIWSNSSTVGSQINIAGGSYSLTVLDANNCSLNDTFYVPTNQVQRVNFPAGWSMFSIFVQHSFSGIASLTASVQSNITLIKDTQGKAYMPAWNLDQLTSINPDFGYQALMTAQTYLYINGPVMNYAEEVIELPKHWSVVAYTRPVPGQVSVMLQSIMTDLIILKDENGLVYWPAMNITDLSIMQPGEAYLIRLANPQSFSYPSN
jgi:hypothetical protein